LRLPVDRLEHPSYSAAPYARIRYRPAVLTQTAPPAWSSAKTAAPLSLACSRCAGGLAAEVMAAMTTPMKPWINREFAQILFGW